MRKIVRHSQINAALFNAALFGALALPAVHAQEAAWPSKPVRLVVTFAPGGTSDLVARVLAPKFTAAFGQSFVIENRAGAGGIIGADAVAKAPADGYSLVVSTVGPHGIGPTLNRNIKYNALSDFTHVALIGSVPHVLLANPKFPAKSLAELIAQAKAQPGKLNYASGGTGSINHVTGELFKTKAQINVVHISYKGSAPAMIDLLANVVPIAIDALPANIGRIRSGELRALAITSAQRSPLAPDIPTFIELGLPDVLVENWIGLSGPAGMPESISRRLAEETRKALAMPDVRDKMREWGMAITFKQGAEFARFIQADIDKWRPIIIASGAQTD